MELLIVPTFLSTCSKLYSENVGIIMFHHSLFWFQYSFQPFEVVWAQARAYIFALPQVTQCLTLYVSFAWNGIIVAVAELWRRMLDRLNFAADIENRGPSLKRLTEGILYINSDVHEHHYCFDHFPLTHI